MLKLTTDKHEASRGLSVTAELLVILTRDIDIAIMSVCLSVRPFVRLSVRDVPVSDENGLTYCDIFSPQL